MACFYPQTVYPSIEVNPSGKRSATWNPHQGYEDRAYVIKCGQCQGCRGSRALMWAARCHHEMSVHEDNCFLTLTYDREHLPLNGTLDFTHHQLFIKKLRKHLTPRNPHARLYSRRIKYYACGEYGETSLRPHFHTCLFNLDFEDKVLWKTQHGEKLFVSPTLNRIWGNGRVVIGALNFASAAYVARYILKKITGPDAELHYQVQHPISGEIFEAEHERALISQGIGLSWLEKFSGDVYPQDFFHINGKKVAPPRAYDSWLEKNNPELLARVKARRNVSAERHMENNTYERLRVREELLRLKMEHYRRIYEV